MDLELKYTPGVVAKYQWHNPVVEAKVTPYLANLTTRPVLFYGAPGSGKSRLGRLLPHMICKDLDPSMHMKRLYGSQATVAKVEGLLDFCKMTAWNSLNMHIISIEEVDDVPVSVMNTLKGFLDDIGDMEDPTLVVMTTNNINKISAAVRDRCELVYVGLPSAEKLFPFAQSILGNEGVTVDDGLLLGILQHNAEDGLSYREFFKRLTRLIAKLCGTTP
ncbi:MAG: AAA family ATPase [Agrobacterium tumefaciens]|nr:AAA family ATPase [Agrobacterium tumefaciens]